MEFSFYIGEEVIVGGTLKDDDVAVTGANLYARFIRYDGSFRQTLGDERFTEDTSTPGYYALIIDTKKYNGPMKVRMYLKDNDDTYVVGEDYINLNGRPL